MNKQQQTQENTQQRRRRLRVELLETRSLLAADVFGCMHTFDEELQPNIDEQDLASTAAIVDTQVEIDQLYTSDLEEELQGEGEAPSDSMQAEGEATPADPTAELTTALPNLIDVVNRADVHLAPLPTEPVGPFPASNAGLSSNNLADTISASTSNAQNNTEQQILSAEESSFYAIDPKFQQNDSRLNPLQSDSFNDTLLQSPGSYLSLTFEQLDYNDLIANSNLLDRISDTSDRLNAKRDLDALVEDLSNRSEIGSDAELSSDAGRGESKVVAESRQDILEGQSPWHSDIDPTEIRQAEAAQVAATHDGMMAMEIPGTFLSSESKLLEENRSGNSTAPIGLYRQGEISLANAALAQSVDPPNTLHKTSRDSESQTTSEWVLSVLRPVVAATSVAFGSILIGFRRQHARDEELRKQFEQLK
ncbi:MAG: hypothetical protein AAF483_14355 [Planctomycetota bacterium]